MSVKGMVEFLDSCWCARDTIVPCIIGPVGIGKTAAVDIHAKNVGAGNVVTIIASQILPNEVSGITMPDSDTKAMEIYDHFRLSHMKDGDILFFDELLEADQSVLKACLTLIESRELMSGRKLPDVQIVAATNPSIKPSMLKENIRQRFLFNKFDVDQLDTKRYILDITGMEMSNNLLSRLVSSGDEYNILTPRSLTKMATWMSKSNDLEEASNIARHVDKSWGFSIGEELLDCWKKSMFVTKDKAKQAIKQAVMSTYDVDDDEELEVLAEDYEGLKVLSNPDNFENTSLKDMVDMLSKLPDWNDVEKLLDTIQVDEDPGNDEADKVIEF